jgi:hypothetical protein
MPKRCVKCGKGPKYREFKDSETICTHCRRILRAAHLKKNFGITIEEYEAREKKQKGLCAICKRPPHGHKKYLCVDHCHGKGHVRGLLCDDCNRVLGWARDKPEVLAAAARYLRKRG